MRATIRLKLIAALVAGLAAIAAATAVLMKFVHERAIALAAEQVVAAASTALGDLSALEISHMSGLLDALLEDERLADAFEAGDRARLLALASPRFEALRARQGITHWYFHPAHPERDGVFLRVHRPELHGDPVRRELVARAAATLRETSGTELGRTAYAVRVVRPWLRGGRLIGFVELGQDIQAFLARMKAMTHDDYGLLLAKERLDRGAWAAVARGRDRWDDRPELLAVETTTGDEAILGDLGALADVPAAPAVLGQAARGARVVARGVFPLRGDGATIGAVVVEHDVTPLHAGVREVRGRVIALVALLATGLAALVVFLLETLVLERLQRMTRLLENLPDRLARGEYEVELGPARDDEVGRFEAFFARALREVGSFVADERRERRAGARRGGDDASG